MAIDRSTPPPVSDFRDISLNVPEPITLANGMKMWLAGNGEDEINKLTIYMTGGGFQEKCPMQATACSMSVFNGNKNMTYSEIAEAIDALHLKRFRKDGFTLYIYGICSICQAKLTRQRNTKKITKNKK